MTSRPTNDPNQSADLLRAARAGDRASFDDLLRRSEDRLLRLVRARMGAVLRGFEESGDLVQSAMAEAVRGLPRFEYAGEGSFLRWLSTIVEHKIRHHLRDLQRQRRDPGRHADAAPDAIAADATSPSEAAIGGELEASYTAALGSLPAADQEVLLLHLDLGCSHAEIAAAIGAPSPEAVRKRIARTLVRLEQAMREPGRDRGGP
jgi:RNA polymerase sigma factor (sigma-70 family)